MIEKVLVSLTSYGKRLKYVSKAIYSILKYNKIKIVLTLYKEDIKLIPNDLQILIDNNLVELIIAPENLGPHLKYYYVMQKYKNYSIITIDDDCIYDKDVISSLINYHKIYPDSIITHRAHLITFNNGQIKKYKDWKWEIKNSNDFRHIFATGVSGILYPPNILELSEKNLNEIKNCLYADDIYLKVLENRKKLKILIIPCKNHISINNQDTLETALSNKNVHENRNDDYINIFLNDLK